LQVLVRPHVVVSNDELGQRSVEAGVIGHGPAVEHLLQRAEEALDAPPMSQKKGQTDWAATS
jgi:hypothetical protein